MNAPSPSVVSGDLVERLDRTLRESPREAGLICQLGGEALRLGHAEAAARAFEHSVGVLLHCVRSGDANNALAMESLVYQDFVKAVEDEDHYERCFARWREPLAGLARALRPKLPPLAPGNPRRVGFLFHAGVILGHTEVLFRLIESCDRSRVEPRFYVMAACETAFLERCAKLGIPVASFPEVPGPLNYVNRLAGLRQGMARDGVGCCVWVSLPITASFAFGLGMAPVQVMWSLRYHPIHLAEVDGYLTYGSWSERERTFHGQRWEVCPVPLALDPRPRPEAAVRELRARFPQQVLLGTLAREEKLDSRPFLECVAALLERHPQCGYLWTGQSRHAGIDQFFRDRGLSGRVHFVGWVDTPLYAAALDVFLESFPLGCGITGYQALAAGVPVLSCLERNTIFGMQYWSEVEERAGKGASRELLDEYPVLCARDPAEYVALASRLIDDAAFRDHWRSREAAFYAAEMQGIARYSKRFFDAIGAAAERRNPRDEP